MSANGFLGIDNRNPWNVKQQTSANPWRGSVAPWQDSQGHSIFAHEVYSARACARVLYAYMWKHNLQTLDAIYRRYTSVVQDQAAYANHVAESLNILPSRPFRDKVFTQGGAVIDRNFLILWLMAKPEFEIFKGYDPGVHVVRSGIALYERDFL